VWLVVAGLAPAAFAQVIEGQPRPSGTRSGRTPSDPNRSTQELTLTFNFTGGFDDNQEIGRPASEVDPLRVPRISYANAGAASLVYRNGTANRYFSSTGRAYINRGEAIVGPPAGGDASLEGATSLGRRMGATVGASVSYEPTSLSDGYAGFSHQTEGVTPSDVTPTQAITSQRWLMTQVSGRLYRDWTTRQRMEVQYMTSYAESFNGPHLDRSLKMATLRHRWDARRNAGLSFSYSYGETRQSDILSGRPLQVQSADLTAHFDRRLSPARRIGFRVGAGASQARSQPLQADAARERILPNVFGSAHLDLTRTWLLSADFRRAITVINGVVPEPFVSNDTTVSLVGRAGRRIMLTFTGTRSDGDAALSDNSDFAAFSGTAQAQYVTGRFFALFGAYTYYDHRLRGDASLRIGLPASSTRNSLSVCVTAWLPVICD
jgi:hypothetical protein